MKLHELSPTQGSKKSVKRIGRGPGSGWGKTSGKGHKGQKARSGKGMHPGFEGGQMPLQRRLPKRGFVNIFRKEFAVVNLSELEKNFEDGSVINIDALLGTGLIKKTLDGVKNLANGDLTKKFTVQVNAYSETAKNKIEAAGGKAEEV